MSSRLRSELAPSPALPSALMASVQVAELTSEGSLPLPPNTTHALIEIGCSDVQTMDEERLDRVPSDARRSEAGARRLREHRPGATYYKYS